MRGRARARRTRCSPSASAGRRWPRRSARSPTRGRLRVLDGETRGRRPAGRRSSSTTARSTTSSPPRRPSRCTRRRRVARRRRRRRPRRCSRCWARPTSPRAGRSSSSTTRSCSRAPCAGPSRPTPPCSRCPDGGAIAVSIDGNGRRVACDPRRGAAEAVYECAANLACVGAEPLGLTNCLNFGNPEKPHVAWQLTEAVQGLARGLRGARGPGRRRQRLALQRGAGGADLPDAGGRDRRPAARRGPRRAARLRRRGRRDRAGRRASAASRGRLGAGQAARRADRRAAPDDRRAGGPRRARGGARRGALRARCASAHDIAEGGLARRAGRVLPRRRRREVGARVDAADGLDAVRRGARAGFVVSGADGAALAGAAGATVIGPRRQASRLEIDGLAASVAVSELSERARATGWPDSV